MHKFLTPEMLEVARTAPVIDADDPRVAQIKANPDIVKGARWAGLMGDNFYMLWNGILTDREAPGSDSPSVRVPVDGFMRWNGAEAFLETNAELLERYRAVQPHVRSLLALQGVAFDLLNVCSQARREGDPQAWDKYDAARAEIEAAVPHELGSLAVSIAVADKVNPVFYDLAQALYDAGLEDRRVASYSGPWPPVNPTIS